jgi:hypothetical protein
MKCLPVRLVVVVHRYLRLFVQHDPKVQPFFYRYLLMIIEFDLDLLRSYEILDHIHFHTKRRMEIIEKNHFKHTNCCSFIGVVASGWSF